MTGLVRTHRNDAQRQKSRVLSLFCCPVKTKTYLCQKLASKKAATKYGRSLRALCLKKTGVYNIDKLFGHFSTSLRNDFRAVWQARCEFAFEPQLTKHSAFELLPRIFTPFGLLLEHIDLLLLFDFTMHEGIVNLLIILPNAWHNHPGDDPSKIDRTAGEGSMHDTSGQYRALQEPPLPRRNHQPRCLALLSVHPELPRCARTPIRTRHHFVPRSDPPMVSEVWA